MNRIDSLFQKKQDNILSVYFTAGFPRLDSTVPVIRALADAGADMIEIGMPFSDPLADGPVLQNSNCRALKNGMNIRLLFSQLKDIRKSVNIPLLLMGYFNPVLQFGTERFCEQCVSTGIDGVILPDLPPEYVESEGLGDTFRNCSLHNIYLITPQTTEDRIRMIDGMSGGFIYMVSSSSTTGVKKGFSGRQTDYFNRIKAMNLKNPCLIGFGISDGVTFREACRYADGAITGSAFVNMLGTSENIEGDIQGFIKNFRMVS